MNIKGVFKILGFVIRLMGIVFFLPALVGLIYKEYLCTIAYACLGFFCILISLTAAHFRIPKKINTKSFYGKEAFVTVALAWILISLIGAVPFVVTQDIPNYLDALFESASGFTTTGASVVSDTEGMFHANIFFRSLSQWIGGMGVLVFILAVLPMAGGSPLSLMKAESPGPTVSKLVPKAQNTAIILYGIYLGLTVIEFVLLLFDPHINVFENICHTFATAGTGGFSAISSSCTGFCTYGKTVTTVFMLLFGTNFSFLYLLILKKFKEAFKLEEVKWYFIIYLIGSVLIFISMNFDASVKSLSVTDTLFTCASLMTSTGFTVTNTNFSNGFTEITLLVLMFIGACQGSTGGGFKVSRFMLLIKQIPKDIHTDLHPNRVSVIKVDKKSVSDEVIESTNRFFITYVVVFIISSVIISIDAGSAHTAAVSALSALNNTGIDLSFFSCAKTYADFSVLSKIVMIFDMLLGRLELIPMILLFCPATWKK